MSVPSQCSGDSGHQRLVDRTRFGYAVRHPGIRTELNEEGMRKCDLPDVPFLVSGVAL